MHQVALLTESCSKTKKLPEILKVAEKLPSNLWKGLCMGHPCMGFPYMDFPCIGFPYMYFPCMRYAFVCSAIPIGKTNSTLCLRRNGRKVYPVPERKRGGFRAVQASRKHHLGPESCCPVCVQPIQCVIRIFSRVPGCQR